MWRSQGYQSNLGDHLDKVSAKAAPDASPEGVDAKIALVPSATELLVELFTKMREHKTKRLIVDLRQNRGGNSTMDLIVQYFLYPVDKIVEADQGYQIPRHSALYFSNYKTASPAELRDKGLQVGDYDFNEKRDWQRVRTSGLSPDERKRKLQSLTEWAKKAPTFDAVFSARRHSASWSPKVFVLTSARTYSAGFNLVTALIAKGRRLSACRPLSLETAS